MIISICFLCFFYQAKHENANKYKAKKVPTLWILEFKGFIIKIK